jgi:division protein CdvB (Snf7/Vps24/ESCRT-III family)
MYDKVKEKSAKKAKAKAKRLRKESEKLADSSSRLDERDKSDKRD